MITGVRYYIAGLVAPDDDALLDFGDLFEGIVLKMTDWGLGTCRLSGKLNRSDLAEKIGLEEGENIAAVTPVGYS